MYLHKTKNGHYTPPCCYFSGELEVVECLGLILRKKAEMRRAIADGTVMKYLQKVPIHKDDLFFIQAGTVHAIGAGALVAEIQENSNLTYRLYDYDRVGKELHGFEYIQMFPELLILHISAAVHIGFIFTAESQYFRTVLVQSNHPIGVKLNALISSKMLKVIGSGVSQSLLPYFIPHLCTDGDEQFFFRQKIFVHRCRADICSVCHFLQADSFDSVPFLDKEA